MTTEGNKDQLVHLRDQAGVWSQRLHTWTSLLVGQFMGSVPNHGPKYQQARYLRSLDSGRLLRNAEVNGISRLLIAKGIMTEEEWLQLVIEEYRSMDELLQKEHPGATVNPHPASPVGFAVSLEKAKLTHIRDWMKDWPT